VADSLRRQRSYRVKEDAQFRVEIRVECNVEQR